MLFANHISCPGRQIGATTVDFAESAEHQMLRDAVAGIGREFGHGYYAECSRRDKNMDELWRAVADHGFLAVHLPEEWGGGGGGIVELAIVAEELAAQGVPLLLILVSPGISAELIARFGTDEQKQRWLPPLVAGEKVVFAITEPDAGSNSHNVATTARRDGDAYRIDGRKTYISGVDEAQAVLVVARTGVDERTGRAQLSLFVVDTDARGLERRHIATEIESPEKQFELFFDDVQVPADRLLGVEGEGLRQVFLGLNPERILGAALAAGIGRYALDRASAYARDREVWGVPIGAHQGLSHPLAVAKVEVELARLMIQKAAWLHDHSDDPKAAGEAANMAKYAAGEAGFRALDVAIQVHGGNGLASEYGIADLWGLSRLMRIAPVSREMILNFVAQQTLGLPRSY
jgi:alkylation response protein AidB-like acyl-CoA dehydrogenase